MDIPAHGHSFHNNVPIRMRCYEVSLKVIHFFKTVAKINIEKQSYYVSIQLIHSQVDFDQMILEGFLLWKNNYFPYAYIYIQSKFCNIL